MPRYPALVVLVALAFHMIAPFMASAEKYHYVVNCRVPLLAVNLETGKGSVVEVEIRAVFKETPQTLIEFASPTISEDTVTSFELAVLYAALALNGTPVFYRYSITSKTSVRGLSATLGFLAALLSIHGKGICPVNYTATGLVIPGGVVGPVGMLEEKINTALESGLENLHVPRVQLSRLVSVPSTVRGVYTVLDLYEELTGETVKQVSLDYETVQAYHNLFYVAYYEMVQEAQRVLEELRKLGFEQNLTNPLDRLSKAESAYAKGKYYVASSLAYTAFFHALRLYLGALALVNPVEFSRTVGRLFNTTRSDFDGIFERAVELSTRIYNVVKAGESGAELIPDVLLLDLLVNVYTRLVEANFYLELAKESTSVEELVYSVAIAYSRVKTAKTWLNILERVVERRSPVEGVVRGYDYVRMFTNVSTSYLSYMLGFNATAQISSIKDTRLALPLELASVLFAANLAYRGFNLTSDDVPMLRAAIAKALALLQYETGSLPAYPVLLVDLVEEYLSFEEPQNVASYLLVAFAHVFTYLYVYSASKWQYPTKSVEVKPVVGKDVVILPLAVIMVTGAIMAFFSVAKMRRSRTGF